ncbi:hypothetical protein NHX12_029349 [Muraenolepis orangiensis]|uniref:EGF-like domain-containing protein n=1 Tax=Muraenolepis orangiensis TaxID=630683 RepID=A0A9Q0EC25_9TELE|nr:hypothetical protein NHX12_029349 [Muraenolepis orangiensis]
MAVCLRGCILLLQLSALWRVVLPGSAPVKCGLGSKLCDDGSECIRFSHVCDGEADCGDSSDERDCAIGCNKDQFQCAHGMKCIDLGQVCDGVPQCQDRSDELQCSEEGVGCAHQCNDKSRCLPTSFLCDGETDCVDGSDEENCVDNEAEQKNGTTTPPLPSAPKNPAHTPSRPVPIKCSLGAKLCQDGTDCVLYSHVCDGELDCKDGSDEDKCSTTCKTSQFQCAHGKKCIEKEQVCDGVPQCQDRSDELECAERSEGCVHQCDDKSRCLPKSFLCDGELDCLDGGDEANCGDNMRCDGYPDCWDHSDEKSCTRPPACTTKHRCPQSKECLVPEWLCDGDRDCRDGTDEKDCPVTPLTCGEFQWTCSSRTRCIPKSWHCDGAKDCDDGSDETDCDAATCPPHQFQCGSQECLEPGLVCNGMTNCADGSDEGGACPTRCPEKDSARCSHMCHSTPKGPRCHCASGFKLAEDENTCVDSDECADVDGVCSHLCINTAGSFQCQCHPGYVMQADGRHCKITGEPLLLLSVQTDLILFGLRSGSLDVLPSTAKKAILSLDYDWREQKVFWASLDSESIRWSSLDQKTKGTLIRGVRADSVAVDWVGRNLYWIDGVKSQIVAARLNTATAKAPDYSVILDEDLDQPRSLALMPQKGIMFWTEIGNVAKIERAGMDGSERREVVNASLGWPGGVAVDAMSNRVYWTDERLKAIGSANLDGEDVQILQMKETTNPFSLAVFNDLLYWSDAKRRVLQVAQKGTGKNYQILLKRPRQPFDVKIIHSLLQMGAENPCEKTPCSHLCVLAPGLKAVCKCPSGLLLAEDGFTCSKLRNSAFMLLLSPSTVTQIYLQARHTGVELKQWPEHLALPLANVNEATMLDFSLRERAMFLTDAGTASLGLFKLRDGSLFPRGQLFKLLGDTITAMALDWLTLNVYWSSTKQPRLQVTSFDGAHTAVLLKEDIGSLGSLAIHPPSGKVCFVNQGRQGAGPQATVECTNMDGSKRGALWRKGVRPTSLVFANNGGEIYWAETSTSTICSIKVDGSGYKELKVGSGLAALAFSDDLLLWMTVNDKTKLWYRDQQQQQMWFEVSTAVVGLKAYSKSSQTGTNQCSVNNGDCHHLCLAVPGARTCTCAHDHVALNATHCVAAKVCPDGGRLCLDGLLCRPSDKFCNGHADCPDHSDENCVHLKDGWQEDKALPPTQPPRSSFPPRPLVEAPTLFAATSNGGHLRNLEANTCRDTVCNGNGDCVDHDGQTGCACALGYSGPACENHFLKALSGPVVYGLAGLFVGLLVLTVVLVAVVKKRRNSNARRTDQAMKETGLTVLENKAESGPRTLPPPPDTTVAEEVGPSVRGINESESSESSESNSEEEAASPTKELPQPEPAETTIPIPIAQEETDPSPHSVAATTIPIAQEETDPSPHSVAATTIPIPNAQEETDPSPHSVAPPRDSHLTSTPSALPHIEDLPTFAGIPDPMTPPPGSDPSHSPLGEGIAQGTPNTHPFNTDIAHAGPDVVCSDAKLFPEKESVAGGDVGIGSDPPHVTITMFHVFPPDAATPLADVAVPTTPAYSYVSPQLMPLSTTYKAGVPVCFTIHVTTPEADPLLRGDA